MTRIEVFAGPATEWDTFVRTCTGWTHYHLHGWKSVMQRVFRHTCHYLCVRNVDGALSGVLPLVRVRSPLFGHYLVSMPFLNYGGPLGDAAAVAALAREAAELADRSGADLLELRCGNEMSLGLPASHRKITVLLDLPEGDADPLWRALVPKVRSQVRRPRKEGVSVRFGSDQIGPFFEVFARHMRDLGTPTQSRALFEAIAEEFTDSVWFGVAWLDGRPVASGCGFRWGEEFEITWAAALRAHSRIAPNMLLYWSFLERCIAAGVRTFNFGRCTPGSGTHRFKQQWGGVDQPLWWYQSARGRIGTPSPNEARYRWGPRIWQRLPVSLATMVGPSIARLLP